jgi:hypothetical protein
MRRVCVTEFRTISEHVALGLYRVWSVAAAKIMFVGPEFLTVVVTKNTIFWDIAQCSPLKVNQRFEGTYYLYLQGGRINRAINQRDSRWQAQPDSTPQECSSFRLSVMHVIPRFNNMAIRFSHGKNDLRCRMMMIRMLWKNRWREHLDLSRSRYPEEETTGLR